MVILQSLTRPDPISALEFEQSPVRVRHLANVGHNDLFTLPANKYGLNFLWTPAENSAESPL